MFCIVFICVIIIINQLYLLNSSVYIYLMALTPYEYGVILSKVCNLLSSLLLSAILLISSVYTLCASLLNLCWNCNIGFLSNKDFL